ncbi:MAG: hypothetical protein WA797_07725 [Acidimicrobiales bacterium]
MTLGALVLGERSVTMAKPVVSASHPVDGWRAGCAIGELRLPMG